MKLKALSVKQPWANLIASGEKTIETRLWQTQYRGDLLIVSSKSPNIAPAGFSVAVAKLVDCRPMTLADESLALCGLYEGAFSWVLDDIQRVAHLPIKGQLGLFEVEFEF